MYTNSAITCCIGLLATLACARLDKPPLRPNLDYLKDGLQKNFHAKVPHIDKWGDGWIPQWCLDTSKSSSNGFNPEDISTYNIKYDDCNMAWVVCVHKKSIMSIDTLADLFGRVPVRSRSYIRHVLSIPDAYGNAYNVGDNIALKQIGADGLEVLIHEVGHSLDAHAYSEPLSSSQHWDDEYKKDSHVPDPYSGTNFAEDVAQSTVLAAYNAVVPGGFGGIEPEWQKVHHQYATVQTLQRFAGNLLVPGGWCKNRLANSKTVPVPKRKMMLRGRWIGARSEKPDTSVPEGIEVIEPLDFDSGICGADIDSNAWGAARNSSK
ncbi:MAG: hypothetical protein L6R40_000314 [Gallowayella cf. fulva]|nr:MAG: hypothetical protein L6R40_000314 [Xanthomendoza cf. fulva]